MTQPPVPVPANIYPGAAPFPARVAQTGRIYILGGEFSLAGAAPTAGSLRLYPVYLPLPITPAQIGVNVTAAGAAGSTLTPTFFGCDAFGNPAALVAAGSPLDTSAIAQPNLSFGLTIPPAWYWVGGLQLSAGAVPTLTSVSKSGSDPRGALAPTDNAAGATALAFQNGLAAVPNPAVTTYISGSAPALYITL